MTTVLWDLDEADRLVLEPENRMQQTMRALATLRQANTVGELRQAELPGWAEQIVESRVELLEDEGVDDVDAAAWRWSEVSELVVDAVPLPWDAGSLTQWLDEDLLHEHATVGGASPGGHSDTYRVHDPAGLLADLQRQGYTLERRPGLAEEYFRAL